jgi:hypothetical protein
VISHTYNFIFIHPAKTGGNSIEVALMPYADGLITTHPEFDPECKRIIIFGDDIKHAKLDYFYSFFREDLTRFRFFATTRNPWDRMVSGFFWFKKRYDSTVSLEQWFSYMATGWPGSSSNISRAFEPGSVSARVLAEAKQHGTGRGHMLAPVREFVTIPEMEVPFQFIRLENFQEDFDVVCQTIGVPQVKLPHTLKTDHEHYSRYYNEERKRMVAEVFAEDIEYFGYEFEEQ